MNEKMRICPLRPDEFVTKANSRWLVKARTPSEKVGWMRLHGYRPLEIFGFARKQEAESFISDVSPFGMKCSLIKRNEANK